MPPDWRGKDIPNNTQIDPRQFMPQHKDKVDKSTGQKIKKMYRYRMMFLFNTIRDIPKDIDITKNYYIEYQILKYKKIRYKLNFNTPFMQKRIVPLKKLRIFYFFGETKNDVKKFIEEQQVSDLTIDRWCNP